jgi:hypothetical protein
LVTCKFPVVEIELWGIDDVYKWVTETLNLDKEDAELLKKQKITGGIFSTFFF